MAADTEGHRRLREWVDRTIKERPGLMRGELAVRLGLSPQQLTNLTAGDDRNRRNPTLPQTIAINRALLIPVETWTQRP